MITDRLKEQTKNNHDRLEKKLDIFEHLVTVETYTELLKKMYFFYSPLEENLKTISKDLPPHYKVKAPLLKKDLQQLGVDLESLHSQQTPMTLKCSNGADAFGILYVLEGSTMGGQVIYHHLQKKLGLSAETGASFYFGYGSQTAQLWSVFKNYINNYSVSHPAQSDRMLSKADETFVYLEKWLCSESPNQQ